MYVEGNRRWFPEYANAEISTSPAAFYVYPTAKIIVVPPVTDSNGQLVCATTSSYFTTCGCSTITQDPLLFPGINSYVEAYFDNSISVTEISLSIPLIYAPLMGANPYANQYKHRRALAPATTYPNPFDGVDVDFGYFPQAVIDLMALNPDYVAQYPQLASCLPGGPSIDLSDAECDSDSDSLPNPEMVETPDPIPTISAQTTIIVNGCFHPGACPTQAAPGAIPNTGVPMATAAPDNAPTSGSSPPLGPRKYRVLLILLIIIWPLTPSAVPPTKAGPVAPPNAPAADTNPPTFPSTFSPDGASETPANSLPYNPNSLSPEQLSQLLQALQPAPPNVVPNGPVSISQTSNILASNVPVPEAPAVDGSPPYNPNNLSPVQLSQLHEALQSNPPNAPPASAPVAGTLEASGPPFQNSITAAGVPLANSASLTISIAPAASALVVNGVTSTLSSGDRIITVGSQLITPNAASVYVIAGQSVTPGGSAIVVGESEQNNAVITNADVSPAVYTVGGQTFTPNPTAFSIQDTIISAGGPGVTIAGTPVLLETSGILKIGTSIASVVNVEVAVSETSPEAYTVGGQVFTPNQIAFPVDGTTISAGGPGATISGTPVILEPSGILKIGTSIASIDNVAIAASTGAPAVYTVGGQLFTPNPTEFAIGSITISAGGPGIMISRTPIILEPSGLLEIGSSTVLISNAAITATTGAPAVYTVGGQVFTPNPTEFAIGNTTISAGGPGVTISGTPITLESSGTLEIGTSTVPLATSHAKKSAAFPSKRDMNFMIANPLRTLFTTLLVFGIYALL